MAGNVQQIRFSPQAAPTQTGENKQHWRIMACFCLCSGVLTAVNTTVVLEERSYVQYRYMTHAVMNSAAVELLYFTVHTG